MDPKMDSGYLEPGQSLEDDYDVLRDLLPEEVIGIMDQILCYEMAWHQGYPLSQTVLSSVYIDRLLWPEPRSLQEASFHRHINDNAVANPLVHVTLRAFCIGVVKSCDCVLRKITSEHYYEEEDFSTHTYNRDLFNHFEETQILDILSDAVRHLREQTLVKSSLSQSIMARLELRMEMLRAFSCNHFDAKIFDHARELTNTVQLTSGTGKAVREAFSEKIQRRLASTAPPKPVIEIGIAEAFEKLIHVLDDIREAHRLREVDCLSSPENLRNFLWAFASRRPPPLPFPRACLQSLILIEDDAGSNASAHQLLMGDLKELVLTEDILLEPTNWDVELPSDPRHQIARHINAFVLRASQAFEYLQIEAEDIDNDLQALMNREPVVDPSLGNQPIYHYPLSSWTYYQKLRQMEWIVQLGFEQDLYLPDELAGMYNFLMSIVADRVNHLRRIGTFIMRNLESVSGKRQSDGIDAVKKSLDHNSALVEEGAGIYYLSIALGTLYSILNALSLIHVPPRPFSTAKLRYELRMRPFLSLSVPETMSHETFEEKSTATLKMPKDLAAELDIADSAVREAKKRFSSLQKRSAKELRVENIGEHWNKRWVSPCLMTCIATGLAVATLQKAQKAHCKSKIVDLTGLLRVHVPDVEHRYHEWWIVPKVTNVE
ncbi:MAG: hypothetical protein M1821_009175 [Bathelium mastoideum]|nr:MAG: hypothetical protein M1821_009175 [Bathelium mastoideum]